MWKVPTGGRKKKLKQNVASSEAMIPAATPCQMATPRTATRYANPAVIAFACTRTAPAVTAAISRAATNTARAAAGKRESTAVAFYNTEAEASCCADARHSRLAGCSTELASRRDEKRCFLKDLANDCQRKRADPTGFPCTPIKTLQLVT